MQNKTTYLKRMLAIYIAFFVVLLAGLMCNVIPGTQQGLQEGVRLGQELEELNQTGPQALYQFWGIPVAGGEVTTLTTTDTLRRVVAHPVALNLEVREPAGDHSAWWVAFAAICGSPWVYVLILAGTLSFLAIIVLMGLIIRSVRRSIQKELPLAKSNVWMLRTIALLTILTDLMSRMANWIAFSNAARMLEGSGYTVKSGFTMGYETLIMALLILFAAELTAIGRDLGEEQKLTI